MTREKAIAMLEYIRCTGNGESEYKHDAQSIALDMAIKALEQGVKTDVLDKIRAEIESLSNANPSYWHTCDVVEREDALDIIDKYRRGGMI